MKWPLVFLVVFVALVGGTVGTAWYVTRESDEIDAYYLEEQLEEWATDVAYASGFPEADLVAECPLGIEIRPSREFFCLLEDMTDGTTVKVTVTVQNDDGAVVWEAG